MADALARVVATTRGPRGVESRRVHVGGPRSLLIVAALVAPEQGGELTRIEQRINHLLKRDSIRGLDASSRAESLAQDGDEGSEEDTGKENPPPFSRRRPPVRRAL